MTVFRRLWRYLVQPIPIRIPGLYRRTPERSVFLANPPHVPAGTLLIDAADGFKVVADGKGGVTIAAVPTAAKAAYFRKGAPQGRTR